MYKNTRCTCKVVVLHNKTIAFLTSWLQSPSSFLKLPTADTLQASLERQKLKFYFLPEKRLYSLMFITAVCFLFLLKLRWSKLTGIYDFKMFCFRQTYLNPSCFA